MDIPEIPESVTTFIFDLDGTIIDSELLHARALSILLEKIGLNSTPQELMERFSGYPDDQVYYEIFNENSQIQLPQFIREKTNQLLNIINTLGPHELMEMTTPDAVDAISWLYNNGKQVALASASEVAIVQTIIQKLGLSPYLPIIKGRTDTFTSKPNPGVYLSIMRELRVSSDQVMIFEDSLPGVQAANAAGAYIIRIGDPDSDDDRFADFEDLAVVDNFSWLIENDDEIDSQEIEASE